MKKEFDFKQLTDQAQKEIKGGVTMLGDWIATGNVNWQIIQLNSLTSTSQFFAYVSGNPEYSLENLNELQLERLTERLNVYFEV